MKKKEIEPKESLIKDLEKKLAALEKEALKDKPAAVSPPEPAMTTVPSVESNNSEATKLKSYVSDAAYLIGIDNL